MKIKVEENRKIYNLRAEGTQNENNVTELSIEVPEQYEDFNKKIVFITNDGTVWDIIENNTYKLKKAITKYKSIRFYIWLTKDEEDFRTEEKTLIFNDNIEVEGELTEEEVSGINNMIKIIDTEITRVTELEKELKNLLDDIQNKLENGELKGEKGDSGIVGFEIRQGNLIAISESSENANKFKIKDGNMILTM